jgi:predicted MFS family arabinose efflux permease
MFRYFKEYWGVKDDEEYLGNIWGWKVSYIGLALIVALLALYAYRVTYHPVPKHLQTETKIEQLR